MMKKINITKSLSKRMGTAKSQKKINDFFLLLLLDHCAIIDYHLIIKIKVLKNLILTQLSNY